MNRNAKATLRDIRHKACGSVVTLRQISLGDGTFRRTLYCQLCCSGVDWDDVDPPNAVTVTRGNRPQHTA